MSLGLTYDMINMTNTVPDTIKDSTLSPQYTLDQGEHCHMFQFIVDTALTGSLCLFGFAGNTLSFMTLWQDKVCVTTFLLQAIIICDLAVLWMIFLGDCVPGLGWVLHILQDCERICGYVSTITQPLLFLARTCGVWLTLLVLVNRYLLMCRPSHAAVYYSLETVRKQVVIIIIIAVIIALPLTMDSHIYVTVNDANTTTRQHLEDVYWYQLVYRDIVILLLAYILPMTAQLVLLVRLISVVHSVHRLRRSLSTSFRLHHIELTQLILTITITLLICHIPMIIESGLLWAQHHPPIVCASLLYYLHGFSRLFTALNSSIKILLLGMFVGDFKTNLKESLTCMWSKKKTNPSDNNYGMYQCSDMSEMTLISNVDSRL